MAQANPNDAYLNRAIAFGSGMRILKQDLWEMIVSFLISQQNNIVRIRRCIANICEKYGEEKVIWVPQSPEKAGSLYLLKKKTGRSGIMPFLLPRHFAVCRRTP